MLKVVNSSNDMVETWQDWVLWQKTPTSSTYCGWFLRHAASKWFQHVSVQIIWRLQATYTYIGLTIYFRNHPQEVWQCSEHLGIINSVMGITCPLALCLGFQKRCLNECHLDNGTNFQRKTTAQESSAATKNLNTSGQIFSSITLPETYIAPENKPSQKETGIPTIHFQGPY